MYLSLESLNVTLFRYPDLTLLFSLNLNKDVKEFSRASSDNIWPKVGSVFTTEIEGKKLMVDGILVN